VSSLKKTNPSSNSKTINAEEKYLYLTTRGRRSGLPREIEIWFTQLGDRFYVMAEYPTSHWVQNLRAHPEVKVRVAGHEFPGTARIVEHSETELVRHVKALSQEKYGWSDGLIVELLPSYPSALS
jgi:deazaflavin-dependent oxidoreductase (nitroreductase family)